MSVIDRNNNTTFKSADYVIADVNRFLKSYNSVNAIDEGEFPTYIRDVLKLLGNGVMKGSEAIIKVTDKIVQLPDDFESLYDIYRCKETTKVKHPREHIQDTAVLYNDITREVLYTDKNCSINCFQNNHQVLERITIKQIVTDSECILNFSYPTPLYISNSSISPMASMPFSHTCEQEVVLNDKKLYLNFCDDWLYLRYYGFPIDEYGVPMIPDIHAVYQAIKWYIIYQISLSWWWNNDVPDIQNKWQQAESQYNQWLGEATHYVKLPSFGEMIDAERMNRKTSLYTFFSNNMNRNNG